MEDYEKAEQEFEKEIATKVLNDEKMDYDIFKDLAIKTYEKYLKNHEEAINYFNDYRFNLFMDGEIEDYDDEDGWRDRVSYIDTDDPNICIAVSVHMRVWDCEFFDEEDSDRVYFYAVKKVPYTAYRYERIY